MPVPDGHIGFLLQSRLMGLIFNPGRGEPLRFNCDTPAVNIIITSHDEGRGFGNLVCNVHCNVPASADQVTFVAGLQQRNYALVAGAPIIRLPVIVNGKELIDVSGRISEGIMIPMDLFPPELQRMCQDARARLHDVQERFIRLIRWRQDIDGPHFVTEYSRHSIGAQREQITSPSSLQERRAKDELRWESGGRRDIRRASRSYGRTQRHPSRSPTSFFVRLRAS
jgi:hypothetical protein